MRPQNRFIIIIAIFLSACDQIAAPVYWSCAGTNMQVLVNPIGDVIERYQGKENLFIEIYQKTVSQFNAPSTFGVYMLCMNSVEKVVFSSPSCPDEEIKIQDDSNFYQRLGVLNKSTGSLVFNETRNFRGQKIISSGSYDCQFLGHRYSYGDMRPADDF